jgi:peptidyl-prolyl cis-trans isomerase D
MYDLVHKHKRVAQFILALIMIPFAFFGVDYYFRSGGAPGDVATYDGGKIGEAEFAQALREQQEALRRSGQNVDPAIFDNPEVRYNILQQVVRERLLERKGADLRFAVPNAQVAERIAADPRFRDGERFSLEQYKRLLAQAGVPEPAFEASIRKQLLAEKMVDPIARGGIVARSTGTAFIDLVDQQREVYAAVIDAGRFAKDVRIDDAQVRAWYDANAASYSTPEEARFEYVVLTQDALLAQMKVTPEEVKVQYDGAAKTYTREEQRDAAHILIAVKPEASDADKAAAKKRAEDLAAQAKANPAKFGELARAHSQDPGSAPQGGELGSNPRGTMVKSFDDAVFAMKPGEIAGPVQSEFGYHVIKLNGVSAAATRPFDEVKAQIETDLRRQKASQKFASAADELQNLAYEQATSLAGAGKALNLTVQTSPWVTRAQAQEIAHGSAKFAQALFAAESITGRRNTEAIEVGPGTLMVGRIVEHKPTAPRPFEQVKDEIARQLAQNAASEMAQKEGREKLALLEQGKNDKDAGVAFAGPLTLRRNQPPPGVAPDALNRIFRVDATKLPQYVGAPAERGGFAIYKVAKVIAPPPAEPAKVTAALTRIAELQNREVFDAYMNTLRAKADVRVNQANLEKK